MSLLRSAISLQENTFCSSKRTHSTEHTFYIAHDIYIYTIYMCVYICIYIHIYVYTCIYIWIYMNIYNIYTHSFISIPAINCRSRDSRCCCHMIIHTMSHHHTMYIHIHLYPYQPSIVAREIPDVVCHIIIHTMSHHHTIYIHIHLYPYQPSIDAREIPDVEGTL